MSKDRQKSHQKPPKDISTELLTSYFIINALAIGYIGISLITQGPSLTQVVEALGLGAFDAIAPVATAIVAERVSPRRGKRR